MLLSVCRPHCEGSAHENCCISNALKDTDILYFLMLLFFSVNCVIMAAQSVVVELCVCEWLNYTLLHSVGVLQCALNDVQTSSKISPLLAYFINFVSNGVSL